MKPTYYYYVYSTHGQFFGKYKGQKEVMDNFRLAQAEISWLVTGRKEQVRGFVIRKGEVCQ